MNTEVQSHEEPIRFLRNVLKVFALCVLLALAGSTYGQFHGVLVLDRSLSLADFLWNALSLTILFMIIAIMYYAFHISDPDHIGGPM